MARSNGFSLVEVILALAIAALAASVFLDAVLYTDRVAAADGQAARGRLLAAECLEVVRWVRDADGWDALAEGTYGLQESSGRWQLVPAPDSTDEFLRSMDITAYDDDLKQVVCTVSWDDGASRSIAVTTLLAQ